MPVGLLPLVIRNQLNKLVDTFYKNGIAIEPIVNQLKTDIITSYCGLSDRPGSLGVCWIMEP